VEHPLRGLESLILQDVKQLAHQPARIGARLGEVVDALENDRESHHRAKEDGVHEHPAGDVELDQSALVGDSTVHAARGPRGSGADAKTGQKARDGVESWLGRIP
jgi:hypothetical protein